MVKKLITTTATLGAALATAMPVLAAGETITLCPNKSPLCGLTIGLVIGGLVNLVLVVAFLLAFAFLVIGGIKWIMSGGDKAGTESAKGTVTAALVGLVIVLVSWALINFLGTFFGAGLDLTNLVINPIGK